jgi:diaminohydroxyphosphoribosylaminopyrimidine deaminase/5-amino-6-(5-phosphoribosylamino)uracil reductase
LDGKEIVLPFHFFPDSLKAKFIEQSLLLPEPELGEKLSDLQAMKLAIQEAYLGLGYVSPNPLVGCVILDEKNQFLSKGFHARVGEAHAEINALKNISSEKLKNARVFVTLEPCAHQGRTGSCAKALAELPIAQVIYGLKDPNPLVSGKGEEILIQAGKDCQIFAGLQAELEQVCEHFLKNFREKRTFVSLKVASSLDGQLGLKTGESKWITDETSREIAHVLRAAHDAILVGANTVKIDQPSLNIRHPRFPNKKNKLVVWDSSGELERDFAKTSLAKFHLREDVIFYSGSNLKELLAKLWDLGIKSLLVEGGAQVLSSFINEMALDRLYLFQAPMICGAKSGKSWSEQVNIGSMSERIALSELQCIGLKADLLITGK